MDLCYYPGCTLKTTAKNFEIPAIVSIEKLGHKMVELPRWNCCGTVHSLAADDLIHQLAPIRTLIRVSETGKEIHRLIKDTKELITLETKIQKFLQRPQE